MGRGKRRMPRGWETARHCLAEASDAALITVVSTTRRDNLTSLPDRTVTTMVVLKRRPFRYRLAVLGTLLIMVALAKSPSTIAYVAGLRGWASLCLVLLTSALMLGLPFVAARLAPKAARFDLRWWPSRWWHWLVFPILVLLLLGGAVAGSWLANALGSQFQLSAGATTSSQIVITGLVLVVLCPITEEIFYRACILALLIKLAYWPTALLVQSLLFAILHFGYDIPQRVPVFFYGLLLGIWRIRFKSILPLIVAHIILNAVCLLPTLKFSYECLTYTEQNPKCQRIDSMAGKPSEKAVPIIIDFLGDRDDMVAIYAVNALTKRPQSDVEPYLKMALASKDSHVLERALLLVDIRGYSGLKQQVREIVWSNSDQAIRFSALASLSEMEDTKELRRIAETHADEKVRRLAARMLRSKQPGGAGGYGKN